MNEDGSPESLGDFFFLVVRNFTSPFIGLLPLAFL